MEAPVINARVQASPDYTLIAGPRMRLPNSLLKEPHLPLE